MSDSNTPVVIAGFLTTLATMIVNSWRESRRRKWDLQDQDRRAQDTAKSLAELTIRTAHELAMRQEQAVQQSALDHAATLERTAGMVITKIEEVGAAAEVAYKEANGVNQKIADLQRANQKRDDEKP